MPVMIHHDDPEDSVRALKIGARFVLHTYDGGIMMRAYRREFGELRRLVSEMRGETFDVDTGGEEFRRSEPSSSRFGSTAKAPYHGRWSCQTEGGVRNA